MECLFLHIYEVGVEIALRFEKTPGYSSDANHDLMQLFAFCGVKFGNLFAIADIGKPPEEGPSNSKKKSSANNNNTDKNNNSQRYRTMSGTGALDAFRQKTGFFDPSNEIVPENVQLKTFNIISKSDMSPPNADDQFQEAPKTSAVSNISPLVDPSSGFLNEFPKDLIPQRPDELPSLNNIFRSRSSEPTETMEEIRNLDLLVTTSLASKHKMDLSKHALNHEELIDFWHSAAERHDIPYPLQILNSLDTSYTMPSFTKGSSQNGPANASNANDKVNPKPLPKVEGNPNTQQSIQSSNTSPYVPENSNASSHTNVLTNFIKNYQTYRSDSVTQKTPNNHMNVVQNISAQSFEPRNIVHSSDKTSTDARINPTNQLGSIINSNDNINSGNNGILNDEFNNVNDLNNRRLSTFSFEQFLDEFAEKEWALNNATDSNIDRRSSWWDVYNKFPPTSINSPLSPGAPLMQTPPNDSSQASSSSQNSAQTSSNLSSIISQPSNFSFGVPAGSAIPNPNFSDAAIQKPEQDLKSASSNEGLFTASSRILPKPQKLGVSSNDPHLGPCSYTSLYKTPINIASREDLQRIAAEVLNSNQIVQNTKKYMCATTPYNNNAPYGVPQMSELFFQCALCCVLKHYIQNDIPFLENVFKPDFSKNEQFYISRILSALRLGVSVNKNKWFGKIEDDAKYPGYTGPSALEKKYNQLIQSGVFVDPIKFVCMLENYTVCLGSVPRVETKQLDQLITQLIQNQPPRH